MRRSLIQYMLSMALLLCASAGLAPAAFAQGAAPFDLERFSSQRLVLDTEAGRSQFVLSTAYVLIQFREEIPMEQQRDMLQLDNAIAPLTGNEFLPSPRVVQVKLRKGISEQEVVELLARLNAMPEVRYANPFLAYEDGTLMGVQDRFHVKLRSEADRDMLESMAREHGATVVENYSFDPKVYVLSADKNADGNAFELSRLFEESGRFTYAEPDFLMLLKRMNTNDTYLAYQWALNNTGSAIQYNGTAGADMEVFNAWSISTGSPNVKVAILDEGTDLTHPDLAANMLSGYDATGNGSGGGPSNDDAHGTACAGIVAAVGNNNTGIAGVAYNCKIIPIRIAYDNGSGQWVTSNSWIATAINWAWNNAGADVLSNSWGGGSPSSLINTAIDNAITQGRGGLGASVLFSAGNGNGTVSYPANYNSTIAVAAMSMCEERKSPTSCDGETWWGSDYGTNLDIAAPGVKIYTTDISGAAGYNSGDYYATFNGTSSACPNAAGVMALIYSVNPLLSHTQARQILETTTEKVGGYTYTANVAGQPNGTWSNELGYGRINAYNAVQAAVSSICVTDTTHPTITAPAAVTYPNDPGVCERNAANVVLGTPTVADNCPNYVVTNDAPLVFPNGVTTVTWTVTDGNNNQASATQTVTIQDVVAPTITPNPLTTLNTLPGTCSVPLAQANLGTPSTTDDCPLSVTVTNDAPASFPLGVTVVTWTATDGAGNKGTNIQIVIVTDIEAPKITAPANVKYPNDPGVCERSALNVNLGTPVVSDNCPVGLIYGNDAPAIFPNGITTVTWTATDGSGNQATAQQIVEIVDVVPPTITAPLDITVPASPGVCEIDASLVNLGTPITTDDCPASVVVSNNAPPVYPLGNTTVTWTATDGGGNKSTATQIVTVIDIEPPTITAPPDVVVATDPGLCSTSASSFNLGKPLYGDNCPKGISVTNNGPSVYPKGVTTVTWTVTDGSGNQTTDTQMVTVEDREAPKIITCASNQSVEGDANNEAVLPDMRGQIVATDNCTPSAALILSQSPAPSSIVGVGKTTVTYTVDDGNGNSSQCTSVFEVVPRVEFDPAASFVVVSGACKRPTVVTKSILIENSGGNFAGGKLQWTASTTAGEITLVNASGYEGDELVFAVDPRFLPTGTVTRMITLIGWNSATNVPAFNSPYTITVSIEIQPIGTVTVTRSVGTSWTPFLNSSGQKIAEVKSNAGPISSFTVNMYSCSVPQGLTRIRYVNRYFTMSSGSSGSNVDVRLYYTDTEAAGLITKPSALTVWQRPLNFWTSLGGSSNPYENYVEASGLTNFNGPFAIAHPWFPKSDREEAIPEQITLSQNYPNPFNPTTVIRYTLPEAAAARVVVHDLFGRQVAVLAEGMHYAGTHEVVFNATGLPSGTYMCTLQSGDVQLQRRMVLMK
ncbi:S8 family serine peptidase [bacterium]|nr:S8 family serine peptidase [bacterium]